MNRHETPNNNAHSTRDKNAYSVRSVVKDCIKWALKEELSDCTRTAKTAPVRPSAVQMTSKPTAMKTDPSWGIVSGRRWSIG